MRLYSNIYKTLEKSNKQQYSTSKLQIIDCKTGIFKIIKQVIYASLLQAFTNYN